LKTAEVTQTVQAPVVARIALPFSVVGGLITALQEQLRAVQEAQAAGPPSPAGKEPLH
jgi:hypothetical protein